MTRLYEFNNHYFEHHGVECAPRKEEDVRRQMQETTALLERLQGELWFTHHVQPWAGVASIEAEEAAASSLF